MLRGHRFRAFEGWCLAEDPKEKSCLILKDFRAGRPGISPHDLGKEFSESAKERSLNGACEVQFVKSPSRATKLEIEFADGERRGVDGGGDAHFSIISVGTTDLVRLRNATVRQLRIHQNVGRADLSGCDVAELIILHPGDLDVDLENTRIGKLVLRQGGVHNLRVRGGTIRSLEMPAPDRGNPFSGSVEIDPSVRFSCSRKESQLFQGAQAYRNLRAHLEALENLPGVARVRALELAAERAEDDHGVNRLLSWLYWRVANYGFGSGRPLLLFAVLYALTALALFFDGGALGLEETGRYSGWRTNLVGQTYAAQAWRAVLLPMQSIFNPFSSLSARSLIVAASWWGHLLVLASGIVLDVLLVLFIIGVRRRFRLN